MALCGFLKVFARCAEPIGAPRASICLLQGRWEHCSGMLLNAAFPYQALFVCIQEQQVYPCGEHTSLPSWSFYLCMLRDSKTWSTHLASALFLLHMPGKLDNLLGLAFLFTLAFVMTKKMDFSWLLHVLYVNQQDAVHGSACSLLPAGNWGARCCAVLSVFTHCLVPVVCITPPQLGSSNSPATH